MDQQQKPLPWAREEKPLDGGPKSPEVKKPDTSAIIKKLVDREASERYRQRSGE